MDHDNKKVFVTGVKRNSLSLKNNLYEIVQKDVAKPNLSHVRHDVEDITCNFIPSGGKVYTSKKKSKLKVSTVRDLRVTYEEDILQTLPNELEKQQKLLLRKIKHGFAKDENTRSIAMNLLKSNNPISRLSWQMLMNLNPEDKIHSSQYILWDGKCIRINGSKGGRNKFICNYDVYRGMNKEVCSKTISRSKFLNKKKSLLRTSLSVRFKPGPLSKKKQLDCSYQKHNVGEVKLVKLPKPGLYIQPTYGTPLEPTVKTFLQNLRENDGTISAKWAEFAVSMLGKVTNQVIHIENENFVTFNLNYKHNKDHFLMRQDLESFQDTVNDNSIRQELSPCMSYNDSTLMTEVSGVVQGLVDAVELSLNQDLMFPPFDEPRDFLATRKSEMSTQAKEKTKRRYGELDRLDVTVIRLSETHTKSVTEPCQQKFCSLGCICDSLECNYNLKDHCGRLDCMFKCKCDFSNCKITDSLDGDCSQFYPGLYYLDKKINGKLSKEEQKFHQTVILKDDKSILLKSNRRNWKASKKYEDFYNNMRLRSEIKNKKILSVVVTKLNCRNVEPWCMVHNLYKCFCKGKFTESLTYNLSKNEQKHLSNELDKEKVVSVPEVLEKKSVGLNVTENFYLNTALNAAGSDLCSRVISYQGRNHDIEYYKTTNKKIIEMEKNDKRLHAKMINILNQSYITENTDNAIDNMDDVNETTDADLKIVAEVNKNTEEVNEKSAEIIVKPEDERVKDLVDVANVPFKLDELLFNILQEQQKLMDSMNVENKKVMVHNDGDSRTKRLPNKTKLVRWLETSYKKYKEKLDKGFWKTSLSPPRPGKVALYPWNFILSRYRERKNLFLISKQKPFRIFMAVDTRNIFFTKCINVKVIPQGRLNNYPVMIRNLINDVKDQNETFCILCGLSLCWELVGSVTKVNESKRDDPGPNVVEDLGDDSRDMVGHSVDMGDRSENVADHPEDVVECLENLADHSEDLVEHSEDLTVHSEDLVENSEDVSDHAGVTIENCKDTSGHSEDTFEHSKESGDHSKHFTVHSADLACPSNNETSLNNITTNLATDLNLNIHENTQISKWFVMTIENDFVEVQFFRKGFFIKYDSIVRAIVVSRQFGKTVRLSSQKCNEGSIDPQFGLYAIPNMYDNCVFIGPYEKDEPLGIEALRKPVIVASKNKTRGMWITVNKIDNAKVINNPLSFMPSFKKGQDQVITFGNDEYSDSGNLTTPSTSTDNQELPSDKSEKSLIKTSALVKPVRIKKADCFKLPFKILTSPLPSGSNKNRSKITQQRESLSDSPLDDGMIDLEKETGKKIIASRNVSKDSELYEPLAKIPPQIKITNVASLCGMKSSGKSANSKRPEKGMFVLKPEEINERLAFNYFRLLQPDEVNKSSTVLPSGRPESGLEDSLDSTAICSIGENSLNCLPSGSSVDESIDSTPIRLVDENSLDSTKICYPPTTDVFIISDEEDSSWKDIWISCTNIKKLGWIPARKNEENKISFKFPSFAYTDFYDKEEAFNKINQVFTRKVYVPKNIKIKWRVVENVADINMADELTLNYLNADFVLTKQGLVHKKSLVSRGRKRMKKEKKLVGRKKKRIETENDSDIDNIDIEYIDLPQDTVNLAICDENKNDDNLKEVAGNDEKGEVNKDESFDDKKMEDEDYPLFEDKEKMDEYRKVFGCGPSTASISTTFKRFSTIVTKQEVFEPDSAD